MTGQVLMNKMMKNGWDLNEKERGGLVIRNLGGKVGEGMNMRGMVWSGLIFEGM